MNRRQKVDWAERRASRRLEVALPLLVRGRDKHGIPFEDTTSSYNVSHEGASFLTERPLILGQRLELIIPRRPLGRETASQADFETTGEIRRLTAHGRGQWEVGVEFVGRRLRTYMREST
jgi:hypothetical protein